MKGKKKAKIKMQSMAEWDKKESKKNRRNIIKDIFCVGGKFDFVGFLKNLIITVGGGFLIGFVTKGSMNVYEGLKKSFLTPPNNIFIIVWTVLYVLMGLAAYRIYMNNKAGKKDFDGYFYYLIQLLVNFLWAIIFFNLRLYGISFVLIVVLFILVLITTIKFFKVDKIAGGLMIPYITWLIFAGYLSLYIWIFNEM